MAGEHNGEKRPRELDISWALSRFQRTIEGCFGKVLRRFGYGSETPFFLAGIAQLVEHHLAKVGVAGSSPVSRSKEG